MFEHRTEPLASLPDFRRRLARHGAWALALVIGSLLAGTLGFWYFAGEAVIDAFLNAAMLLGGMGPVGEIRWTSGKVFAALFALYAGLAFLGVATLVFTPIFHRMLHRFHLEDRYRAGRASGSRTPRGGSPQTGPSGSRDRD